ncbi:MAG: sulfatase-like hydrolase/transferase [Myxococcales bacterium]|nr:sulfatase-like hydrolase/transferase [Myxococcales bacterium]
MSPSPPQSSLRPLDLRGCLRSAARVGVLGAGTGLLIGVVGQLVVARFAASGEASRPSWWERLVGVVVTASLLGALLFLATVVALVLTRRSARRSRRRATMAPVALIATLVVLVHALGVTLHVLLGSHLTSSGLAFFLNSSEHIAGAVSAQYLGYLLPLIGGAALFAAGLSVLVRRVVDGDPARVRSVEVVGCVAMTGVAGLAAAAPAQEPMGAGVARTSPEVALLASVTSSDRGPDPLLAEENPLVREALRSPSRASQRSWEAVTRATAERPNVVIITLESVAISRLGYLDESGRLAGRQASPNIDRIAAKSLRMRRAYTTATHSNYAQMAVISSLFPRRGSTLDMYQRLDYPRVLLHDLGSALGYTTATVSSQDETWQGMKRFQDTGTATYFRHAPDHQGEHLDLVTEDVAPDQATVDHAIGWLKAQRGTPFSLYLNLQSTHFPYPIPDAAPKPFTPYEPKGTFNYVRWEDADKDVILNRYDNALHYVDAQVGRLYDALEASGLLEDTIFVITADHGELFFEHDLVTHGRTLFDGESRVPLLVHYPAALEPRDDFTPVSTLDVLPTVVDLMGAPPHPAFQGESFRDTEASERSGVFLNIQGWKHYEGVVCGRYKLVFDPDSRESELYDLIADPNEERNLAFSRPELAAALRDTLRAQMEAQEAYHANGEAGRRLRDERFAPRMLPCPDAAR